MFQWNITNAMSAGGLKYVSWLELPYYRLIKREEECLRLKVGGEGYGLTSVSDDDKLQFANGIECDAALMAHDRNQSEYQVLCGLFPKKVTDALLGAFSDHEKLSMLVQEGDETGRLFGRWFSSCLRRDRLVLSSQDVFFYF